VPEGPRLLSVSLSERRPEVIYRLSGLGTSARRPETVYLPASLQILGSLILHLFHLGTSHGGSQEPGGEVARP
jgi:hypothetical protein